MPFLPAVSLCLEAILAFASSNDLTATDTATSGFGSRFEPLRATAPSMGCERSTASATPSSVIERTRSAAPGSGRRDHAPTVLRMPSGFATRPTITSPAGSGTAVVSGGGSGATATGFDGVTGAGGGAPPPHATSATRLVRAASERRRGWLMRAAE